eukprot:SAG31_NODE_234_length_19701_cov_16.835068_14_plen_123_part_00
MAQSQHFATADGVLMYGLLGSVSSVPAGWSSSVILSLGKGGPNVAVRSWGKKLLLFFGKTPALSKVDFISTHLGFDTDNGAFCEFDRQCLAHFASVAACAALAGVTPCRFHRLLPSRSRQVL